jgi:hypothetical protein
MDVSINGAPAYHWTVSTGRPGYDTPAGSFRAIRLERVYFSKKYDDAPMPNAVFFYGGYAIHGTLEEKRLGSPVSHGCVRLARPNAATLFALVQQHGMHRTRIVVVEGVTPRLRDVPVARFAPRETYRASYRDDGRDTRWGGRVVSEREWRGRTVSDREWREEGFRRGFATRKPAVRSGVRSSRGNWREAPPRRGTRTYDTRTARPVMREAIVVHRPARGRGFDW